jgi:hypothetical protein
VPEESTSEEYPKDIEKAKAWKMVHKHNELQNYLIQQNKKHFSQAHGTPFTIPPLSQLSWGADDKLSQTLLNGNVPEELHSQNKHTKAILQYIANRKQLPDIELYISPEEVARGFRRWRETTSTSPSGCHLGL